MAGTLYSSLRQSSSSSSNSSFATKLLLLLTLLPFTLAAFAFVLQWRGGVTDPSTRYSVENHQFPGMESSAPTTTTTVHVATPDCEALFTHSSPSFPYFRNWKFDYQLDLKPKIAITSTSASLDQILPWMFFHKVVGVTTFYLFVEGKAASPEVSRVLESILNNGVDWILHLDTDELIHPAGTREYSLRQLLLDVPPNVDMVVFPNYVTNESGVERDDILDPFCEVSMFKKNYDHLPKDTYFGIYKEATRGNPNYFLTYGNGKSIARIQDHLRPNGAHRWHNYMKSPNEIKFEEAAVLHHTYAKFSGLTSRRDRCGCKPTKEDVKCCFMLEFDREAFIIASIATGEEMRKWYQEHVVWADKTANLKLLRKGILTRIYAPMAIVQGLRESGVFTSVIESASRIQAKDNLSSIGSTNSTRRDK